MGQIGVKVRENYQKGKERGRIELQIIHVQIRITVYCH